MTEANSIIPPQNDAPVTVEALQSKALFFVIIGKTVISLSLSLVAIIALFCGKAMMAIQNGGSGQITEQALFQYGDLSINASGFGAVVMMSGVLFGILAYLSRPKLTLKPTSNNKDPTRGPPKRRKKRPVIFFDKTLTFRKVA